MSIYDIDPTCPKPGTSTGRSSRSRGRCTFETIHRTKDGVRYPVEVTANFVEYEGQEYNFVFARDITERKKMEEKLRLTQYSVEQRRGPDLLDRPRGQDHLRERRHLPGSWATRAKSSWA